jgi:hypothetical protein
MFGTRILGCLLCLATFGKHKHTYIFTTAVRQRYGSSHHLVRLSGINSEFNGNFHSLIELGSWELLEDLNGFVEGVTFAQVNHFQRFSVSFT